jgi:hypothetical protein
VQYRINYCGICGTQLIWPENQSSHPIREQHRTPKYGNPLKPFHTKLSGVTHKNEDGMNRQNILKRCHTGEKLNLIHYPVPQDHNAVKVLRQNGEQIGWLNSILAAEIAPRLDRGSRVDAVISAITGNKKLIGCNIQLTKYSMR